MNNGTSALADDVTANEVAATVNDKMAAAKEQATALKAKVKDFVDENPVIAVAGAVAAGFLVGRLLSRL